MTRTARYSAETNSFRELPGMEKPIRPNPFTDSIDVESLRQYRIALNNYESQMPEYQKHLSSLREIPCHESCRSVFKDQGVYEEGVQYEVKEEKYCICHHCHDQGFKTGIENACRYCNPDGSWRNASGNYRGKRFVAYPLVPAQGEDEDKLWYQVKDLTLSAMDKNLSPEEWVGLMKGLYHITPR